ncbi:MAG: HD domain-containing protein [Candidatus Margulisbacteria bacterium]|nr:HD domain-containing protein [Candidatus Margulisiibacteriota bacterium]
MRILNRPHQVEWADVKKIWRAPISSQRMLERRLLERQLPRETSDRIPIQAGPSAVVTPTPYWRRVEAIILQYAKTDPSARQLITQAFRLAWQGHNAVFREGEKLPYIVHPVRVAVMAAKLGMSAEACAAALMHDLREDAGITKELLIKQFNPRVADLVEGVTELGKEVEYKGKEPTVIAVFRKWFEFGAREHESIILKLLDRLDNMRTIDELPLEKQRKKAEETLSIHARVADRMGIWPIKRELEDLCFAILEPAKYQSIREARDRIITDSKAEIREIVQILQGEIESASSNITIVLETRAAYELYERREKRGVDQFTATDIWRINLVVESEIECFILLGIIHGQHLPVQPEIRDYISDPLPNGHRFLQTYIITHLGPLLVQIRDREMYDNYQRGILADHRQGGQQLWISALLEDLQGIGESGVDELRRMVAATTNPINVFARDGRKVELPWGATVLDFARWVHEQVFIETVAARVNERRVSLSTPLRNGDRVVIETDPASLPSLDWLDWVQTREAAKSLRGFLQSRTKEDKKQNGLLVLAEAAAPYYLTVEDLLSSLLFRRYLRSISNEKVPAARLPEATARMLIEIGEGKRRAADIIAGMRTIFKEAYRKAKALSSKVFYVQIETLDRRGLADDVMAALKQMGYNVANIFTAKRPGETKALLTIGVDVVPSARTIQGNRELANDVGLVGQIQRMEIVTVAERAGRENDQGARTVTRITAEDYQNLLRQELERVSALK